MDRKEFFIKSLKYSLCSGTLLSLANAGTFGENLYGQSDEIEKLKQENEFIKNWLSDLMNAMYCNLDEESRVKLIEECGKGCYSRHKFKQEIALKGKGNLDNLIEAYKENFEIWKEEDKIHIRYGKVSQGCYCPVGKCLPNKSNDSLCECTKATHQAIFENALGRPVNIKILESVRRGGKTCHFLVEV